MKITATEFLKRFAQWEPYQDGPFVPPEGGAASVKLKGLISGFMRAHEERERLYQELYAEMVKEAAQEQAEREASYPRINLGGGFVLVDKSQS